MPSRVIGHLMTQQPMLDYLTLLYGMKQVKTERTHILENSSSCIDLIFSNHFLKCS